MLRFIPQVKKSLTLYRLVFAQQTEFLNDPELGLESKIWKLSHYKLVEEFRKQLKVSTAFNFRFCTARSSLKCTT